MSKYEPRAFLDGPPTPEMVAKRDKAIQSFNDNRDWASNLPELVRLAWEDGHDEAVLSARWPDHHRIHIADAIEQKEVEE